MTPHAAIAELARLRGLQDAALTRGDTPTAIKIGRDITNLIKRMEARDA